MSARDRHKRLKFSTDGFDHLTHYAFRYPAKFHPPVARQLIESYTEAENHILDPFCGSGTLLVEATAAGRHSTGVDLDPVAVFVSSVKTRRYRPAELTAAAEMALGALAPLARSPARYAELMFEDISETQLHRVIRSENLWLPSIPNLRHWFRRYVLIDLARILRTISDLPLRRALIEFLKLCFASIIRNASNADPVPVSGLEVTSHMIERDRQGRLVDPFALYKGAIIRAVPAAIAYGEIAATALRTRVFQGDATQLRASVRSRVDCVITSPPYHSAVDYYRRHQLEMYWLGFARNHSDRLTLRSRYLGQRHVAKRHPYLSLPMPTKTAIQWQRSIARIAPRRADDFKHYVIGFDHVFRSLSYLLEAGRPAIFVVGHSQWAGKRIPTSALLTALAGNRFKLESSSWYPVKNRYMSYDRKNGADINREYVLVFRRTSTPAA